jgi:hypothetical protein
LHKQSSTHGSVMQPLGAVSRRLKRALLVLFITRAAAPCLSFSVPPSFLTCSVLRGLRYARTAMSSRRDTPPPVAARIPHTVLLGRAPGERKKGCDDARMHPPVAWPDDLFWLRDDDRKNENVLALLDAENRYTEGQTAHLAGFRQRICETMCSRMKEAGEVITLFLRPMPSSVIISDDKILIPQVFPSLGQMRKFRRSRANSTTINVFRRASRSNFIAVRGRRGERTKKCSWMRIRLPASLAAKPAASYTSPRPVTTPGWPFLLISPAVRVTAYTSRS